MSKIIVLANCGNGYCGCDSEEVFIYEAEVSQKDINEDVYDWACENAESFAHVHFGWDGEYSDEEYEEYIENHDIRAQINKLKKMNVYFPCEDELRKLASVINSWEVDTRYNDNFVALLEDINEVREISDKLISYCDSLVSYEDI
jgi:hypothetical protein